MDAQPTTANGSLEKSPEGSGRRSPPSLLPLSHNTLNEQCCACACVNVMGLVYEHCTSTRVLAPVHPCMPCHAIQSHGAFRHVCVCASSLYVCVCVPSFARACASSLRACVLTACNGASSAQPGPDEMDPQQTLLGHCPYTLQRQA
eukprot:364979-Chlamydomonas_euryale.AAC.6